MTPHPDIAAYLHRMTCDIADFAKVTELSPQQARTLHSRLAKLDGPGPALASRDFGIQGDGGLIPLRLYQPVITDEPRPLLIFVHGGGWVGGDLDTHDVFCRNVALQTGYLVMAAAYRCAPEDRFPAALYDALITIQWCLDHVDRIGADPAKIAVGGDSAGGNLVAAALQTLRAVPDKRVSFQLLLYPALDLTMSALSHSLFEHGPGLTGTQFRQCIEAYLPNADAAADLRASPGLSNDLTGLPPTFILTAELDILRDEAESYGAALIAAGVRTEMLRWPGATHGFLSMPHDVAPAREGLTVVSEVLRRAWIE